MQLRAMAAGILLLHAAGGAPGAAAFDSEAQIHGSDLIVTGRVLSIRYEEAPDESWSRVEVEIRDTWKGNAEADRIVVRAAAGALANPNFALEGAARFQTGENVLLFLTRSDDQYRPWAMVFGKYPIQGDGSEARLAGNLPFVAMDLDETGVVWLDDLRHEVDVIVARHTEEHLLDLALNP